MGRTEMTMKTVTEFTLEAGKEPVLEDIFGGQQKVRWFDVRNKEVRTSYVMITVPTNLVNDEDTATESAQKIVDMMIQELGLEETLHCLEAMASDPGRMIPWEEFEDS